MNICNDNHENIAFEDRNCPLCELRSQHTEDIDTLHSINSSLLSQLENLEKAYSKLSTAYYIDHQKRRGYSASKVHYLRNTFEEAMQDYPHLFI